MEVLLVIASLCQIVGSDASASRLAQMKCQKDLITCYEKAVSGSPWININSSDIRALAKCVKDRE